MDDILQIIRKGQVDNLTQHLNQDDETGSIKFTYEEGKNPFLDTLIVRKEDDTLKLLVYRKPTHISLVRFKPPIGTQTECHKNIVG